MAYRRSRTTERLELRVDSCGRLVLPSKVRNRLGIREGDRMILTVERDGSLRLVRLREQVKKAQGMFQHLAPGASLAEELIRERCREVARENSA